MTLKEAVIREINAPYTGVDNKLYKFFQGMKKLASLDDELAMKILINAYQNHKFNPTWELVRYFFNDEGLKEIKTQELIDLGFDPNDPEFPEILQAHINGDK